MPLKKNPLRSVPFYPFLLGIFPVLSLLGHNAEELQLVEGLRSIVLVLLLTALLLLLARAFLRTWDRAAIWTSIMILGLLSYGHLYHALRSALPFGNQLVRHRYLASVLLLAAIGFTLWIRRRSNLAGLRPALNAIALLLLVLPGYQILRAGLESSRSARQTAAVPASCRFAIPAGETPPDIYYVILDAYARNDVLQRTYGFDNQPFLDALQARGFYVTEWAQSNYARTGISLESSLNMSYFDLTSGQPVLGEQGHYSKELSIGNNVVRQELTCLGYQVVAFDSGYYWSGWRDADVFLSPVESAGGFQLLARVNPFESLLLYDSAGLLALDASTLWLRGFQDVVNEPMALHRQRVVFALQQAGEFVPKLDSPKFVFVHVVSPHRPFVLGFENEAAGGQGPFTFETLSEYGRGIPEVEGYRSQVLALNERVLAMVDGILAQSRTPPVIILQGDHGTGRGVKDRMSIFSAYYLPGDGPLELYPTITPINGLRVVFRRYFTGDLPLLEDHTYFSEYESLFDLTEVPNPHAEQ